MFVKKIAGQKNHKIKSVSSLQKGMYVRIIVMRWKAMEIKYGTVDKIRTLQVQRQTTDSF